VRETVQNDDSYECGYIDSNTRFASQVYAADKILEDKLPLQTIWHSTQVRTFLETANAKKGIVVLRMLFMKR
jgi:hypothetical protein